MAGVAEAMTEKAIKEAAKKEKEAAKKVPARIRAIQEAMAKQKVLFHIHSIQIMSSRLCKNIYECLYYCQINFMSAKKCEYCSMFLVLWFYEVYSLYCLTQEADEQRVRDEIERVRQEAEDRARELAEEAAKVAEAERKRDEKKRKQDDLKRQGMTSSVALVFLCRFPRLLMVLFN